MSQPSYNTVVFSRKKTYNDPNSTGSSLSSIIQQTDKDGITAGGNTTPTSGKQKKILTPAPVSGATPPKGLSKLFLNLCSTLGLAENTRGQTLPYTQPPTSPSASMVPPPGPRSPSMATPTRHLPPVAPQDHGKKCLVLDLDETLVHSSFKPTLNPDYILPVEIEGTVHNVYVAKRPGVDEFMRIMAQHYEIVIYTASLSKYADPLLDQLDIHKTIRHRLFREHCVRYENSYVKDLSLLDRDLSQTIIIDNSAMSYVFHPQNAIGCTSFIDDLSDRELISIQKFLIGHAQVEDVRDHLFKWAPDDVQSRMHVG